MRAGKIRDSTADHAEERGFFEELSFAHDQDDEEKTGIKRGPFRDDQQETTAKLGKRLHSHSSR